MVETLLERISVQSKKISSIKYDPETFTLYLEYKNFRYRYLGIPDYIYENFMKASSREQFYTKYIKNAGFSYEVI